MAFSFMFVFQHCKLELIVDFLLGEMEKLPEEVVVFNGGGVLAGELVQPKANNLVGNEAGQRGH